MALWNLMVTQDPKVIAHRKTHYGTYWMSYKRVGEMSVDLATSVYLLYFLPGFAVGSS